MSSFSLGQTSVSHCAGAALAANGLSADTFFARHAAGDWGAAEAFDQRGNAFALAHGVTRFLIQSAFPLLAARHDTRLRDTTQPKAPASPLAGGQAV